MFNHLHTTSAQARRRWLLSGGALVAVALPLAASVAQAAGCASVQGKMTLVPVPAAECSSPVGICVTGTFKGGIDGTLVFTATSLTPTVDTATTGVVLATGDNTIAAKDGTITTKDAIVLQTTGQGMFAEIDTIVGGTGSYAGATGAITATGVFDGVNPGQGRYSGEICLP
ncbi:hypothetical protein OO014_16890 [Intrasporangium calvum]|uniref:Lipoprotein n=1 Tax=Intrasporangium calvum TaxID=53358 RepID=A0ABT5GL64_9MICO|nr:hypothetical protein [Intrasporangium calvum]MDC5698931.1 hypothetical protein [Intrasporangium calvum]